MSKHAILLLAGSAVLAVAAPVPVGMAQRSFKPQEPYIWRGAKTHALVTTVWYPAVAGSVEQPQWIGPPGAPLFSVGSAAPKARPADGKFPLVVLSHGTGGSALTLGWLGITLAAHGYIAAAVNHPGNNALEAYTPQGFSIWWERARDLSEVISKMESDAEFGGHIDPRRVGAAGFSLGGYTMIEIAGGITDRAAFRRFCQSAAADGICKAPPEFPELVDYVTRLDDTAKADPEVAGALKTEKESHRDERVRAVFAIAPALGPAFPAADLKKISIPVEIVAGMDDDMVPVASSAQYFAKNIPKAKLVLLPGGVQHYQFLSSCTGAGKEALPQLCTDKPGVNRDAVHEDTAARAVTFFNEHLKP